MPCFNKVPEGFLGRFHNPQYRPGHCKERSTCLIKTSKKVPYSGSNPLWAPRNKKRKGSFRLPFTYKELTREIEIITN